MIATGQDTTIDIPGTDSFAALSELQALLLYLFTWVIFDCDSKAATNAACVLDLFAHIAEIFELAVLM